MKTKAFIRAIKSFARECPATASPRGEVESSRRQAVPSVIPQARDEPHPMSLDKSKPWSRAAAHHGAGCEDRAKANPAPSGRGRNDREPGQRHGGVGGDGRHRLMLGLMDENSGGGPSGPTPGTSGPTARPVRPTEKSERPIVASKPGNAGGATVSCEALAKQEGAALGRSEQRGGGLAMVPSLEIQNATKKPGRRNGHWVAARRGRPRQRLR